MINALTGNTTPQTYPLRDKEGTAWVDVDKNGRIDDSDAYLTLETEKGAEYLDLKDVRQALQSLSKEGKPVSGGELVDQLKKQYDDSTLLGLGVVNGSFCFDMISTYRHQQTFSMRGEEVEYTLEFDPTLPTETYQPAPPPEEAPLPQGAVSEPTCVDRDGILHWLFPGEVPQAGDKVIGNTENFAENLGKR
ncbi:hypothetical protein IV102_05980 [bacterium]|nr:hypothetical protein [bacterium]